MRIFNRKKKAPAALDAGRIKGEPSSAPAPDAATTRWLGWLADAPLFIDHRLVTSFHDATLRPDFLLTSLEESTETSSETTSKLAGEASVLALFPGLGVKASAERAETKGKKHGQTRTVVPVTTPSRDLLYIALHYLATYRAEASGHDKIWDPETAADDWRAPEAESILDRPRMLAFLDFPPGTKFLPVAMETDAGVEPLYKELIQTIKAAGEAEPPYRDDVTQDGARARAAYWAWMAERWSAGAALEVVEKAAGGNRVRWVNYRVPVNPHLTLHLNLVGHGEYDTGIYAYNIVKRGFRQGLRVVGTVRAEPGLNVMAIYDK